MNRRLLLSLSLWLFPAAAWAQDASLRPVDQWHQWRGPLANGSSANADPPLKWDEKTNIKWKTPIPGRGSSTPIIWGDRIFVQTAIDTGRAADPVALPKPDPAIERKTTAPATYHQFVLLCISRTDGKVLWQRVAAEEVPHEGHHPTHSYAAFSPTTDGRYVYISFGSRGVSCYDLRGELQWKRDLGRMSTRYGWGEGASPALHGDTLIVNCDQEKGSFLIALDARTGKTKWKVDRDEPTSWSTPLIVEHKGRTQVIVNATNRVRSYDLATGKPLWQCGGQTVNVIPSPVVASGLAICMSGYGAFACAVPLDAQADVTDTDKVAWIHKRGTPYVPSPLLVGDRLYFTQHNVGLWSCLDVRTGKPILDRARLPAVTGFYGSPVAAAGRIYLVDRAGTALVLKQSDKLEVLAVNHLDDHFDASPAVAGRQLVLRGQKHLYCIETK